MRCVLALVIVCAVAASPAFAQQVPQPPKPCATPEYRQFDFWVGDWDVTTPEGRPAGTNRVERILGGCALLENWESHGAGAGKSLTLYEASEKRWNQTWVDATGNRVVLTGGLEGARMVLANTWTAADGKRMRSDLSWTPHPDGTVRQVWRESQDDGQTYQTTFDGTYTRRRQP